MSVDNKKTKMRFNGFNNNLETYELSKLLTNYYDPVEIPHNGYERLGIRSHAKGTFHSFVPAGQELQSAQMHRVATNKFIVNITFGWEHAVAITDKDDEGKLVSHRFPQFNLDEKLNPSFFKYIILDEKFRYHLWLSSPGGAGRNKVLNIPEMLEYKISIPSVIEQQKIAKFLDNLDSIINLNQLKYEKLLNLKQFLLENLFPNNKEKYPNIRFSGFNEEWENRRFDTLAKIERGLTYSPSDVEKNGIRVLRSSNINGDQFKTFEDDVFVNKKVVKIDYAKNNDILITAANGSANLVGKHTLIQGLPDNTVVHGGFMLLARPYYNPYFLNASMSSSWYKKFIDLYVAGGNGAIGNLNKTDLDEQIVKIPSEKEMLKIGKIFKNIDKMIVLQEEKIDKLSCVKKAMINNLIV